MISVFTSSIGAAEQTPVQDAPASIIADRISSSKTLRDEIAHLRDLDYDSDSYRSYKKTLSYVTWSGTFTRRSKAGLKEHSGLICLDLDKLHTIGEDPESIKMLLEDTPHIWFMFTSPSNKGLKVICRTAKALNSDDHKALFTALRSNLLESHPQLTPCFDSSGSDVSRACFLSYDPRPYRNDNPTTFTERISPILTPNAEPKDFKGETNYRLAGQALDIIYRSEQGNIHESLLKASRLMGGYISGGEISEGRAVELLTEAILTKPLDNHYSYESTIRDGITHGKESPLEDEKRGLHFTTSPVVQVQQTTEWTLKPIGDYADEYGEAKIPDPNPLILPFNSFNQAMRNKYRGKLCAIVGYGGTKKSLFVKDTMMVNARRNKRIIYSQMEMGVEEHMDRLVDYFSTDRKNSEWLESAEIRERGISRKWVEDNFQTDDKDLLLHTFNSGLQTMHYAEMEAYARDKYGRVDVLIVDGLNMMGVNPNEDSETKAFSRHSKELKALANSTGMLIMMITHVSRGDSLHKRDLRDRIRGSEKIWDNLDFAIHFSRVCDEGDTESYFSDPVPYHPTLGWARLVDKRGGGGTVDRIFDLDTKRMCLVELGVDPSVFTPKKKTVGRVF